MSGISCFAVIEGIILRSILILVIISFLLLLYVEQSTNNNGLVAHDFTDLSHNLNTFYLPSDFFPYIRTAGNRSMGS